VERDAMMIMWLNRFPAPRLIVDPQSNVGQFIERYLHPTTLGYQLFWLPNDLEIPACMAILLEGQPDAQRIFVGLAANLSPEKAAMNALLEAVEVRLGIFDMQEMDETIDVPEAINNVHKHAVYYVQQDRTHLLDFLLNTPNSVELAAIPDKANGEPQADLAICLDHCRLAGQDVFVADVTKEDIQPFNLRVVRVIMPGMQRLTTNHNAPYLGNTRPGTVPVELGWRTQPLAHTEFNRDPHPFI
jgi:ribosomal protein S12 methylthiotransferase accessory factor